MASIEEIRSERIKKLDILKKEGANPYPITTKREFSVADALENFTKLSKRKKDIVLAGRVMSIRKQGAVTFLNFNDGTDTMQAMLKKTDMKEKLFSNFSDLVDIGDFVELSGPFFITKTKQKTISVKKWTMLSKSLRSLPDKWHGLQDIEERFRKRYLDTLMSQEVKDRFIFRSRLITKIRNILNEEDFIEVETPMLQHHAGGATALPFITHHNALDIDLYLRIAPELYLKRLLVGGFPKVYEIGRNFRNEGIDVTHNPEFTMLEFYESYSGSDKQMVFVEKMIKDLVNTLLSKKTFIFNDEKINVSKSFKRVSYFDLLKRYALITNPDSINKDELILKAGQLGVGINKSDSLEKILDNIYKKTCRPKLIQPTFITNYPVNYLPLAKKKEDNEKIVDAFQLVIGGIEFVKGFSELNDPIDQSERFKAQEKDKKAGDDEAQTSDEDFLEAMEYGIPPAGGVGIGIDRLMMLLTDSKNIREVILFPILRPKK
jgi:lysyl-tRNA synthetase class 2